MQLLFTVDYIIIILVCNVLRSNTIEDVCIHWPRDNEKVRTCKKRTKLNNSYDFAKVKSLRKREKGSTWGVLEVDDRLVGSNIEGETKLEKDHRDLYAMDYEEIAQDRVSWRQLVSYTYMLMLPIVHKQTVTRTKQIKTTFLRMYVNHWFTYG